MKARVNHKEFFSLLNQFLLDESDKEEQKELKETYVSQFTNNRTVSLREMQQHEYDNMILSMRDKAYKENPKIKERDYWRKKVIKTLKEYNNLQGYYIELSDKEKTEKAKGTAEKNQGGTRFNKITVSSLKTIVKGFERHNKTLRNANIKMAEDLSRDV